jgi:hypothetical protein
MTVKSRHADYGIQVNNTGRTLNLYEGVNLMTVKSRHADYEIQVNNTGRTLNL